MTYQESWTSGLKMLQTAGIEDAKISAGRIFEFVYGIKPSHLILHRDEKVPIKKRHEFRICIERRAHHEPLQYIVGSCGFMEWDFAVDSRVLIPRQDTEILVEEFVSDVSRARKRKSLNVLDLCSGSGCIGISIKKNLDRLGYDSKVVLSDISFDALSVARANARAIGADVIFAASDMFEKIVGRFDAILCNPPYIPTKTCDSLMPEVSRYEPRMALDGGSDGLDYYRILAAKAKNYLAPGARIYLEIGSDQARTVGRMFINAGYKNVKAKKDLAGLYRMLKIGL